MRKRPWIHDGGKQGDYDTGVTTGISDSNPGISACKNLSKHFKVLRGFSDTFGSLSPHIKKDDGTTGNSLKGMETTLQFLKRGQSNISKIRNVLKASAQAASTLSVYFSNVYDDVNRIVSTFPGESKIPCSSPQSVDPATAFDDIVTYFKQICQDMIDCGTAYNHPANITISDDLCAMMKDVLDFGNEVSAITDASNMDDITYRAKMKDVRDQICYCKNAAKSLSTYLSKLQKQADGV